MNRTKSLALLYLLMIAQSAVFGQFNSGYIYVNHAAVIHDSDTINLPWCGGINNPQFSAIDLNTDGTQDLFVYDKDASARKTFIYNNENQNYEWDTKSYLAFPRVESGMMILRDYNADGKADIFTKSIYDLSFVVYKNTSTANETAFDLASINLTLTRQPMSGFSYFHQHPDNLPVIQDLDGDGDLDILFQPLLNIPNVVSGALNYIKNLSMEKYGVPDSLVFQLVNPCWGKVTEYNEFIGWSEYDCNYVDGGGSGSRHTQKTTMAATDLNNDGRIDLILGDMLSPYLTAFYSHKNLENAEIYLSEAQTEFPPNNVSVNIPSLTAPYLIDLDHDGLKDLIAAPNQVNYFHSEIDTSITKKVDWFYKNVGTSTTPDFQLQEKGFLNNQMIDVGWKSYPVLADINGDSLLDLIIGNNGLKRHSGKSAAYLTFYENVGTKEKPAFKLVNSNFANVTKQRLDQAHPTFGDIDNDGDQDMFVGDERGQLHYYKNVGTPKYPNFLLIAENFRGIKLDTNAHPQLFDLSNDGTLDFVVGDGYGRLYYFENSGTKEEWDFSPNPNIERLGKIFLYKGNDFDYESDVYPYFTKKADSTGNTYLLLGTKPGNVLVYGPIKNLWDKWTPIDSIKIEGENSSITGGSLENDSRDELIIGQRTGGLYYLLRERQTIFGFENQTQIKKTFRIYPNPTSIFITIEASEIQNAEISIEIKDITGKLVFKKQQTPASGFFSETITIQDLNAGIYLISLQHDGIQEHHRIIKN